jgi:hypothetical protein
MLRGRNEMGQVKIKQEDDFLLNLSLNLNLS